MLLVAVLSAVSAGAADRAVTWKRWDLRLAAAPEASRVDVTFTGPGGTLKAPAFRTSDGAFLARVAFPRAGKWSWSATADVGAGAGLKPARGQVDVARYRGENPLYRHGFLRVSANGRYLEHADGTPFLWMGDTVWFGPTLATDEEWREYLNARARAGFTVVQISALGPWPRVLSASVPIAQPFEVGGAPSASHWDHMEARIREANERGLVVLMVGLARPPSKGELEYVARPEYARHVVARVFGDHVILSPNFDQVYSALFDRVGGQLRENTAIHLITQHPNTQNGQNDLYVPRDYLSFTGLQSGHHNGNLAAAYTAAREWPVRLRGLQPVRPVLNIEAMYDGRGNDSGPAWRRADARKLGWISWLSGALGYTYGAGETARKVPGSNGGMWGFNRNAEEWDHWRKVLGWASAGDMTRMREFFLGVEWWRLAPAPELLRNAAGSAEDRPVFAVADDRSFGVGYLPASGAVSVDLRAFAGHVRAEWFDPTTGERRAAEAESGEFRAPAPDRDWVLLLRR